MSGSIHDGTKPSNDRVSRCYTGVHMLLFVDNLEEMQWDHGEGQITKHSIQSTEIPIRVL